jgi:putative permease
LLPHVAGFFSFLIYIVMMPLLVFFMLKDKELIFAWFARYIPSSSILRELYESIDQQFGSYIRGKLLEAAVVGGASWVGFIVIGLDYAFALAVLVGLSVLIPFVGAVAVTFPVLLVAYFQFGADARFVYLAVFYTVVQVLDGQVLVPLLFSEAVKIHPVALLSALLLFGGLWGFWGVFFAIPLAALLKSVLLVFEKHTAALKSA